MTYEELKIKLKQMNLKGTEFGVLIGGSKRTIAEYARIGVPAQIAIIVDQMTARIENGEDIDIVIGSVKNTVDTHKQS